jgi:hypothetical protein
MTVITKIDPGMAAALEKAKRVEIKMRKRWQPAKPLGFVSTYVQTYRDGTEKLRLNAVVTARRVWPARKYTNCRAMSRPGDSK